LAVACGSPDEITEVEATGPSSAERLGVVVTVPEGMTEVAPQANDQMTYDFALRSAAGSGEVRWAFRPVVDGMARAADEVEELGLEEQGDAMRSASQPPVTQFQAIWTNVGSAGPDAFQPTDVMTPVNKELFGAD
jgi:hypothetical protein